jgi:hypothetical protein
VGELVNEKLDVEVVVVLAVEAEAAIAVVAVAVADDACTFVVGLEDTVNVEEEEEEDIVGYDQKYHVADENAVRYLIMDLMMLHHEQEGIQTDDHERKSREMKRMTSSEEPSY